MAVFDAVICKHFSVHVKKHCFLILHRMMLTHTSWNETFLYSEVPSSFLVNTVLTLSKSVYNCQSYWQKFRGRFLWPTVYMKHHKRPTVECRQSNIQIKVQTQLHMKHATFWSNFVFSRHYHSPVNNTGQTDRQTDQCNSTTQVFHRERIIIILQTSLVIYSLTLWRLLLPYGYSYKASHARLG